MVFGDSCVAFADVHWRSDTGGMCHAILAKDVRGIEHALYGDWR
jgi:hypothetical protein